MSDDLPTSHKGKIGSFPAKIREGVNRRLHDGQNSSEILPWLHSLEEVLEILDEHWGEQPVTPQNLSEWRKGGYRIWQKSQERHQSLQQLTEWALSIEDKINPEAINKVSRGITAGKLLELVEIADEETALGLIDTLGEMTRSEAAASKARTARERLALQRDQVELRKDEHALSREKFETLAVEKFLTWAKRPEATAILNSGKPQSVQMPALRELFFGAVEPQPDSDE